VLHLGMTSDGVGLAALIAEWSAVALALVLAFVILRGMGAHLSWPRVFDPFRLKRTLLMNGDVMIRTLCLVFAFTCFTARGARAGDVTVAANAVLINLFEVSAYLIDGFAYASEALVGQSVGARNRSRFRAAVHTHQHLGHGGGRAVRARHLVPRSRHHRPDDGERGGAGHGAQLSALGGLICFQFDGIFTGAMATKDMRNMMIVSLGVFLLAWWLLEAPFGNHGLWAALNIFFIARGVTFATRMPSLERRAFG